MLLVHLLSGHFGPRTLRHLDTEVSGQFGTGAEVSQGHFGSVSGTLSVRILRHRFVRDTLAPYTLMDFVLFVAG